MRKRALAFIALAFLVFGLAGFVSGPANAAGASEGPSLSLTPLPPRLPTSSGSSFSALVVSLVDSGGNPEIALNATTVYLSSAQDAVLTVQSSVTIPAGLQYKIASVTTTPTEGASNITAESPGYNSAHTVISTYTPRGYPTQLRVFSLPSDLPAGQQSTTSFAVEVVDPVGLPARTTQDTVVQLTSSDTGIASLSASTITIPFDKTIGYGALSTTGAPGYAAITATSSGFVSGSNIISVYGNSTQGMRVVVSSTPGLLPADGGVYNVLTVSLVDNESHPVAAGELVHVLLSSSRTDIATTQSAVDIPQGSSFAVVPVTTSPATGSTNISASASGYLPSWTLLNTALIPPTNLGIYLADSKALTSQNANTLDLVVQLQDASGNPAEARSPATVTITFSNTSLLASPLTLTIDKGQDLAYASVSLARPTDGVFSAISTGLESAYATFSATPFSVAKSLTGSSSTIHTNETSQLVFTLQEQGVPLSGASLQWSATGGKITPSSSVTDGSGNSIATFVPTAPGVSVITVIATHPVFGTVNSTMDVVVVSWPVKPHPSFIQQLYGYIPFIGVGVAAALAAVYFLVFRRRKKVVDEDAFSVGESAEGQAAFNYLRISAR